MSNTTTDSMAPKGLCGIAVPLSDAQHKSKELALSEATSSGNHNFILQAVGVAQERLWDNGQELDYSFFGGSPKQHAKVNDVIQEWTLYANVTFKQSTPNNPDATIRITFNPSNGSWSYVGNDARTCAAPAPTMNLGWIGDTDTLVKKERGVILHEFGHLLGLMHEHESPARSGTLRLKEAEIIQYYSKTQGWDEATIRKQILDVYSKESVSSYTQFDPTSIMMYFMPAEMNEGGVDIPEVTELSMLDKAWVAANYPRDRPHPRAHQWTPQFALIALGANADIIAAYKNETDINDKRAILRREMASLRLSEAKRLEVQPQRGVLYAGVQHAPEVTMYTEKVQNGILDMLLNIAPKILLAPNTPLPGSTDVAHAVLDSNNLTLDHPVVQYGLINFFGKLASNPIVKKAMAGAVKMAGEALGKHSVQHALDATTHAEKVQNGILDILLNIAPKILLTPNSPAPGSTDVAHAVLDPNNITLDHPVVQHGLLNFFGKLASNPMVKTAMTGAVKMVGDVLRNRPVEHAPQILAHAEKVQNGILDMLLNIAPKILLAPNPQGSDSTDVAHAVLDPNNLTLDHPAVQHGLLSFFGQLASNPIVKKVMTGAVKMAGEAFGNLPVQHAPEATTHAERVQNSILSMLLNIAPMILLAPNPPVPGSTDVAHTVLDPNNLTLDHPVVQHGLVSFFGGLASNPIVKKAMTGALKLATGALSNVGVGHALETPDVIQYASQVTAHAEQVQNGILGLLLNIAPKILLAPNPPAPGSTDVAHAVLDPNNLALDHPAVQYGLLNFFKQLASNPIVKNVMTSAVNIAGEALTGPQRAAHAGPALPILHHEILHYGILHHEIAHLAALVVADPSFKDAVDDVVGKKLSATNPCSLIVVDGEVPRRDYTVTVIGRAN